MTSCREIMIPLCWNSNGTLEHTREEMCIRDSLVSGNPEKGAGDVLIPEFPPCG